MPGPQLLQRKFVEGPFPQLGRQKKGKGGIREELLGSDDEKGDLPDDQSENHAWCPGRRGSHSFLPDGLAGRPRVSLAQMVKARDYEGEARQQRD